MKRNVAWLRLGLARLRDERAATAAFVLVVFVTSLLLSLSPRLYDRSRETALRSAVSAAPAGSRGIELSKAMAIAPGPAQPTASVNAVGAAEEERLPSAVRSLIADRTQVIESPRWLPVEPILWTTVILRIQDGVESRLRYLDGRPPDPTATAPPGGNGVPLFEAALSVRAAAALGIGEAEVEAGRLMEFTADTSDALAPPGGRMAVRFTGIFEPAGSLDDSYWFDDRSLVVPRIRAVSADDSFSDVAVVLPPASYAALAGAGRGDVLAMRFAWRYLVDPERLAVEDLDALAADLHSMEGRFRDGQTQVGDASVSALRSRLVLIVDGHLAEWRSADVTLVTAGVGPVGLAAGAIGFLAALSAQRRTRSLRAAHGRGATVVQMILSTLFECLLLAVPATVLAAALAVLLVPEAPLSPTLVAATGVALVTTLLLVVAVISRFVVSLRVTARRDVSWWVRHRRLVGEALVVGLAVGGTFLLLERGVRGVTATGQLATADVMLAAVPALVALAAGVAASRAFPWVIGSVARLADRRRDFVPVLALRRASREAGGSPVLTVLVAAAMMATFSAAMLAHLDRAAVDVAWHEVGGAHRVVVDNGSLPAGFDLEGEAGVEAAAPAFRARGARTPRAPVELVAIDIASFERVVSGTPSAVRLNQGLSETEPETPAVVVSTSLLDPGGIRLGQPFQVRLAGRPIDLMPVQARASFPTLPTDRPFVVASLAQLRAAHPDQALGATELLIRGPDDAAAQIEDRLSAVAGARLESRAARTDALRGAPVMAAVVAGVAGTALMAGGYAILALAAAIALRGSSRIVETAQLRTLGLSRGEAVGLSIAEHGAPTLTAFVVGTVVGVGTFTLVRGSVGLGALLGSGLEIPAQLGVDHIALLLGALLVVAAAGIAVGAAAERRTTPSTEIRRGFDP